MTERNYAVLKQKLTARLGFLKQDPDNRRLIIDAADLALQVGDPQQTMTLLDRAAALSPLSSEEQNLLGLAAMKSGDFEQAASTFATVVRDAGPQQTGPRFNLAWSLAVLARDEEALSVLDDITAQALPQAAALLVQLLHKQGRLDEALDAAKRSMAWHPDHSGLLAAVSVLAIDCEDVALAAETAARAGNHPDALTTLGTLALGEEDTASAKAAFARALALKPDVPRALIGRGLAAILDNDPDSAAQDIEKGAAMFGDHLGSWIAAGWARFIGKDYPNARRLFEHALALDATFSESHGSLAVLDIHDGAFERAKERIKIATRLDRNCFSAAFARILIANAEGDEDKARRIFEMAVSTPIGKDGRTVAQSLMRLGMG